MSGADHESWLNLSEIGRRIGRGASTVTAWRNRFRAYLAYRTQTSGPPLWRASQFELIDRLLRRGHSNLEIERALSGDDVPDAFRPEEDILAVRKAVLQALTDVLAAQREQIETLKEIRDLLRRLPPS